MSEFFSFLQQNRSQIGLVDRYDLSEIYDSDERVALRNLLLEPNNLDQIYTLSGEGLTKEDVRTMGGLDKSVVRSLAISEETYIRLSYFISQQITTNRQVGEPGKQSFSSNDQSDNIIVFHGGLAAKKIEYNFLDESGQLRKTTIPTSRESLFDSIKNDAGSFTSVSYPGLFRIRRRSHVNQLRLANKLLIQRGSIIESPTDTVSIPVYMRTTNNTNPSVTNLRCYATKNSPLVLLVRISNSANISIARRNATSSSPAFVFGWELRRFSDLRLARRAVISSSGAINTVNIDINTAGTICNGVDSFLYIYLDPAAVISLDLSGIGLTEMAGKDIGLIGFNSLEELDLSENNLSTLPVWLKTLNGTLKKLNIRGNRFWNNGIVQYFDWQDAPTGVTGAETPSATPEVTLTQVLGYSGWNSSGRISGYDGRYSTAQDNTGRLYKELRKLSLAGSPTPTTDNANGFRPFSVLEELNLGPTVDVNNADFSRIFPNLKTLVLDSTAQSPDRVFGLIPKLNNNGGLMSINVSNQFNVGGSIRYLGDTIKWTNTLTESEKSQFIGRFNFQNFNINNDEWGPNVWWGGICTSDADITAGDIPDNTVDSLKRYSFVESGSVVDAWSGWLNSLRDLRIYFRDIAFRIASGENLVWNQLGYVLVHWAGHYTTYNKVRYNASVLNGNENSADILNAKALTRIDGWHCGWYGKIFSISRALELVVWNAGYNNWDGYVSSTGEKYILPANFATASTDQPQRLRELYLHHIIGGPGKELQFRETDLKNLPNLEVFQVEHSYFVGKFPTIYTTQDNAAINFRTWFANCRFRDLSALGTDKTSRVSSIYGPANGTGAGGCLVPNFNVTGSNDRLSYINLNSTLSSRYPSNWYVSDNRDKLIGSIVSSTLEENTPSVVWNSTNSEKLTQSLPGSFVISSEIMVGDRVFNGNNEIGVVTQLDANNAFIYINQSVSLTNATLKFRRAGQNISNFFNFHTALDQVYMNNAKLTGTVPTFTNSRALRYASFSDNLFTNYETGTFKNITGVSINTTSSPALRSFSLERNCFSKNSIRRIISEIHEIAVYFRSKNINPNFTINLFATKYDSINKQYSNWQKTEIFDQSQVVTDAQGQTYTIPDPLEVKFNQLGSTYPNIRIQLFDN